MRMKYMVCERTHVRVVAPNTPPGQFSSLGPGRYVASGLSSPARGRTVAEQRSREPYLGLGSTMLKPSSTIVLARNRATLALAGSMAAVGCPRKGSVEHHAL